ESRFDALYRQFSVPAARSDDPAAAGQYRPTGRYATLIEYLGKQEVPELSLSFTQAERIMQHPLPPSSRRHPAFWSSGNHVGKQLLIAGWRASLRSRDRSVMFRRVDSAGERSSPALNASRSAVEFPPDVVLVGCVKSKRQGSHRAEALYTSALFH